MEKINTKPLSGFMELSPSDQMLFNKMRATIQESYELYGFRPIDTPILERAEVLLAKGGGETDKQIYTLKKGENDLALRFDLTVPLARYVAEYQNELAFPFKRYAIGKVFRGERPQAGRFREFYQCDIDVAGRENLDLSYDAEIPSIIATVFNKLGLNNFTIRINNRKILNGILEEAGLSILSKSILTALDNLEKRGEDYFYTELKELELTEEQIKIIDEFLALKDLTKDKLFDELRKINKESELLKAGIEELETVINEMVLLGVDKSAYEIDLTIARGLDYYTGTVYETRLNDYPEIGSVCSGGRYDDLTSYYTKTAYPGVGISIGLTRLFDQLQVKKAIQSKLETPTKVLIVQLSEKVSPSLSLAKTLRENGIPTEITNDLKKGMKYANALKIPHAIFIGEEEEATNIYAVKDLTAREQKKLSEEDLLDFLKEEL